MQIVAAEEDKRTSTERDTVSSAAPRCHARQDEVDDDPMAAHGRRAGPWSPRRPMDMATKGLADRHWSHKPFAIRRKARKKGPQKVASFYVIVTSFLSLRSEERKLENISWWFCGRALLHFRGFIHTFCSASRLQAERSRRHLNSWSLISVRSQAFR